MKQNTFTLGSSFNAFAKRNKIMYNVRVSIQIQVYTGGPVMCNGYLVAGPQGYVAIDAPAGFADWATRQLPTGAKLTDLLLTHQHFDHVQDAAKLHQLTGCHIHAAGAHSKELTLEILGGGAGWIPAVQPYTVDDVLAGDTQATWGGLNWQVYHIPGHSPDGVAYSLPAGTCLFVGDILFAGSIGRTDFPGGSQSRLVAGIKEKLMQLPPETEVYSGHGPSTSLQEEELNNPWLTC